MFSLLTLGVFMIANFVVFNEDARSAVKSLISLITSRLHHPFSETSRVVLQLLG